MSLSSITPMLRILSRTISIVGYKYEHPFQPLVDDIINYRREIEMPFTAKNPNFAEDVKNSFTAQRVMNLIGASLSMIEAGAVDITLPYREDLTQQNGFIHAGIITTIADSSCGYAAYSMMPADSAVLSVEFKINLLKPAIGERFTAEGRVIRAGKTLTVAQCDVLAHRDSEREVIAIMQATIMRLEKK